MVGMTAPTSKRPTDLDLGTHNASMTARARARAELTEEIKRTAREHLRAHGASGLSLRAVARDLGMVSSAVYRYFASRDELLTALIIDAYNAVGESAERADESCRRSKVKNRFRSVGRAVRQWAIDNPHEYALVFGSPVPGYAAPQDTIVPATRMPLVLIDILRDAYEAGKLDTSSPAPMSAGLRADAERVRAEIAPRLPAASVARAMAAWPSLYGAISFELFGHFTNVIENKADWFDYELERILTLVGL
jgi:AcrR family transcriptional regulator